MIRVDGSRRITVRNIGEVQNQNLSDPILPMHPMKTDNTVREPEQDIGTAPLSHSDNMEVPENAYDDVETKEREVFTDEAVPVVQGEHLADNNDNDLVDHVPTTTPRETSSCDRPKRSPKPNKKYSPEEYDLSTDQVKSRVRSRRTIRRAR